MRNLTLALVALITNSTTAQMNVSENNRSNSVYYELFGAGFFFGSVNYDCTYHFHQNHAIRTRVGLGVYGNIFAIGAINYMVGNGSHYGEIGLGGTTFFLLTGEEKPDFFFKPGYRYVSNKGLVVTATVYISSVRGSLADQVYIPGLGFGYAF